VQRETISANVVLSRRSMFGAVRLGRCSLSVGSVATGLGLTTSR